MRAVQGALKLAVMEVTLLLGFGAVASGITVGGVIALILAIAAWINVFRNPELSGSSKALWFVTILFVPIFGSIIYFSVRSDW